MIELAILSESPADEKGLLAFASGVIGSECCLSDERVFRSRGWPAVLRAVRSVAAALASWAHPAALLIVADGNGSPLDPTHPQCRASLLLDAARAAEARFRQGGHGTRVLVGVAYPSIEAWWLAATDSRVGEHSWAERGRPGGATYNKVELKRLLYRSEFASLAAMETRQAEAGRLAAKYSNVLSDRFPVGCAPLIAGLGALRPAR